jgi:sugar O-acyltransferase (sialic acid O-acetyltransferase NeuD family)
VRRPLIVLGSSGLAREMAHLVKTLNRGDGRWEFLGFVSHDGAEAGRNLGFGSVLGDDAWMLNSDLEADVVVGIGHPAAKARALVPYLEHRDRFAFPNLVHPGASIDFEHLGIGEGNVIAAGAVISCDIRIGNFNLFNWNSTVGHDAEIGDYNVINPGANVSGYVRIGSRVLVGTGCQILEGRTVGSDAVLGASALIRTDVAGGEKVGGVPARPLGSA